jgi:hypothetical protein
LMGTVKALAQVETDKLLYAIGISGRCDRADFVSGARR